MAWTARILDAVRTGALATVTVRYTDGLHTEQETHRVLDLAALNSIVYARLSLYNKVADLLAAPPLGDVPPQPEPTPTEVAVQRFTDDIRLLRQVTSAVSLGILDPTDPRIATLKASLTQRLTNTPALIALVPVAPVPY